MSDNSSQANIYGNVEKYVQIGYVNGSVYFQKDKVFPQVLTAYPKPSLNNIINRDEELVELHEIFKNKKFLVITGFGGIGKTIFSGLYREKYINEYEHLVWIRCISNVAESFYDKQLLGNLGITFEVTNTEHTDFYNEALGIIINRLNEIKKSSLLIIDNANNQIEQDFIYNKISSLNNNWKILITSREDLSLRFEEYELNFLSIEQARGLFYLYYKREHNNELVDQIVQIVGLHTLTIELLARTAQANRNLTLDKLKELLIKEGLNISKAVLVKTTYDKVKVTTYILDCLTAAFAMVTDLQDSSIKNILLQFSVVPSIFISYGELIDFLKIEDDKKDKFNEDLNLLEKKGLVLVSNDDDSFKCHQVLQEVIRIQLKPTTEDCKDLIDSLIAKLEYDPIANAVEKAKYLPFAESILHGINEDNLHLASLAHNMNDVYDSIGEYQKAIEYELKAIAIREKLDNDSLDLSQSYNNVGVSYTRQNNLKESLKFHRKALNIRKKLLDKHHSDIAHSLSNIANVHYGLNNINRAIKLYTVALNIWQNKSNQDKSLFADIARAYNDLGMCFLSLENYKTSKELLEKSLAIQFDIYDKNHPEIITSMVNLGTILFMQEKHYDAIVLYEQILEAQQSLYQSNHPFIVDTKKSLELIRDKIKLLTDIWAKLDLIL